MKIKTLMRGVICLWIGAFTGQAAVIVTTGTLPPTEFEVANPLPEEDIGSLSWRWTTENDRRDIGQQFQVAEAFTLSSIVIHSPGASPTTDTRNFSVIIESFADTSLSSARTTVSEQTGVLPSIGLGGYLTFELETPVAIEANTRYGFRLAFAEPLSTNSYAVQQVVGQTSYPYAHYQINYSSSSTPSGLNARMVFYLVPIPEPTSGVLLLGAVAGIGVLGRRRKTTVRHP